MTLTDTPEMAAERSCEYLGDFLFLCACGYIYDTRAWVQPDGHIHDCPFIPRSAMLTDAEILAKL